ncbi:Adenosylmethionine-8-amino-7-oxononanoate aminotransferase [Candidatus Methylopumilus planktonicus]|uniref:Adenosylmethionine-8-amino-7-oxononanoate aminotransferase n=2 Tax=Candidatus Methylopumilus planktonicus TaxID=1581557 RepID=A0A0D6ETS9_9PROT|nr:adenosylmethionine--8-amino-7-oxononanoate transaminase [Candidatus Methylopumilus planktonicus]CEZ19160.1 Adenosylmethionine-8-amino-7-oxononanoate aminotransferase [Candidatus Methylopumilus planktonicus]
MKNKHYIDRSLKSLWNPCTQMKIQQAQSIIPIRRGKGVWLYDYDDKKYLDAISSWWVNLFGHNQSEIKKFITDQLDLVEHIMLAGLTHEPVINLSEKLSTLTNLGHAFYGSDGSNAIEIAIKMSVHYWKNRSQPKKNKIIYLENSYHGETLGALSVTDIKLFRKNYASLIKKNNLIKTPDWRYAYKGETAESYALRCIQDLEIYLQENHQYIAAFILEPLVQCATGMGMYHSVYLKKARELCTQYQIHLIDDEIAVGFGRTGKMFAFEHANIKPDFICLSKGLTGGYLPLSAVLTTDEIYMAFYENKIEKGFLHSHSYTGNPLACSAALGTLSYFENHDVINQNNKTSAYISERIKILATLPISNIRNIGMIWAFDLEEVTKNTLKKISMKAIDRGLLIRPIGQTIYFMPPYVINHDEINFMIDTTLEVIESSL